MNAAVKTSKGTKVADLAWFSPERWEQVKDEFDASVAPEIDVVGKFQRRLRLTLFDRSRITRIVLFSLILKPSTHLPTTSMFVVPLHQVHHDTDVG